MFLVHFSVGDDSKQEKCTLAENQKPKWSTITVTFQCMRAASDEFCQTAKLFGCFFQQERIKMTYCGNETPAGLITKILFCFRKQGRRQWRASSASLKAPHWARLRQRQIWFATLAYLLFGIQTTCPPRQIALSDKSPSRTNRPPTHPLFSTNRRRGRFVRAEDKSPSPPVRKK